MCHLRDFPCGPVVKNLPFNAGDVGSVPGEGTKILRATEQLSLGTATAEPVCHNQTALQANAEPVCHNRSVHHKQMLSPCATTSVHHKQKVPVTQPRSHILQPGPDAAQ